jgi:hypothetical protein
MSSRKLKKYSRISAAIRRTGSLPSLKDIPRGGSEFWSGVTPDGSPLISRAEIFQEIYALDVEWP